MAEIGLSVVAQMKMRMQWLQARQKVLAENVSNADLPNYKPRDVEAMGSRGLQVVPVRTTAGGHIRATLGAQENGTQGAVKFETRPSGNAVSLEDEMNKLAQTQTDYQIATTLYSKTLGLLKTAVGKR
jgi:flagellar basal-body rod protein FlgB